MKLQNWQRSFNVSHNTTDTFLNDKYLNWFVKLMYAFTFLNASPEQSYNQWLNCCAVSWSLWIKKTFWKTRSIKRSDTARQGKKYFLLWFLLFFLYLKSKVLHEILQQGNLIRKCKMKKGQQISFCANTFECFCFNLAQMNC